MVFWVCGVAPERQRAALRFVTGSEVREEVPGRPRLSVAMKASLAPADPTKESAMSTDHDPEPRHTVSQTAHVLAELQLYGHHPSQDEPDPRPLPDGSAVAGATFGIGQLLLACVPWTWARLLIVAVYATPAAVAGYSATHGIARMAMPSPVWQTIFSVVGAIAVGITAVVRISGMAPPPGQPGRT